MIIRDTENRSNVFFEEIINNLTFCDLQGLIFGVSKDKIEHAIINANPLPLIGIEAVYLDENELLIDSRTVFDSEAWKLKHAFCKSLDADLFLITYKETLFYGDKITVNDGTREVQFNREFVYTKDDFVDWWERKKGTRQTKKMYEARSRLSIFDEVLETKGIAWGGNIDGIFFNESKSPVALVETRFSNREHIETYDPSRYFHGTRYKAGDYMTWLPLWYLSKYLDIPLLLLTFSVLSSGKCGVAVIKNMDQSGISYETNPPTKCIFDNTEVFTKWFNNLYR